MSAPQLTNASSSSEWIRTVAEAGGTDKRRRPSQTSIADDSAGPRRKRFVRLVTYTMVGLVGFTLLGVASFTWRQHAMQSALAAPAPVTPPAASPALAPPPVAAAEAPPAAELPPAVAPAAAASTPAKGAAPKVVKKTVRRSLPSSSKPATKSTKR